MWARPADEECSRTPLDNIIDFGLKEQGKEYTPRPGAYAVVFEPTGGTKRFAVVEVSGIYHLPGGGIEIGESRVEALKREVSEETGLAIEVVRVIGEANEYVYAQDEGEYFKKLGTFYEASVTGEDEHKTEADHLLLWVTLAQAEKKMSQGSHVWAVREALRRR